MPRERGRVGRPVAVVPSPSSDRIVTFE